MNEKELRRLSRADLLEILIDQSRELQSTQNKLREAECALENREIAINNAGSIAEAALTLSGVFEAAQTSCNQYIENIRSLNERQDEICRRREAESLRKAEDMLADTEKRCAVLEAETKEKCAEMLKKAQAEADSYWEDVSRKLEAFCSKHAEVRELLNASPFKGSGK